MPNTQTIDVSNFGKLSYIKDKIGGVLSGCSAVVTVKFDQFEIKSEYADNAVTNFNPIPSTIEDNHTYTAKTSVNFRGLVGIQKTVSNELNAWTYPSGNTMPKTASNMILNLTAKYSNTDDYPFLFAVNDPNAWCYVYGGSSTSVSISTQSYGYVNNMRGGQASNYLYFESVSGHTGTGNLLVAGKCANVVQYASNQECGGYSIGFNEAGPLSSTHPGTGGVDGSQALTHWGPNESADRAEIFLKYADVYVGKPKNAVYWDRETTEGYIMPFNTSINHYNTISYETYSSMKAVSGINDTGRTNLANGIKLHMQNELTYAYNNMYNNNGKNLVIKYFYYI